MTTPITELRQKIESQRILLPQMYGDIDFDVRPERFTDEPDAVTAIRPMLADMRPRLLADRDQVSRIEAYTSSMRSAGTAAYAGTKVVLPGRYQVADTGPLFEAMMREQATVADRAPAIFEPVPEYLRAHDLRPGFSRTRLLSGPVEPSPALMRGFFEDTGADVIHGYGATETSPPVASNRWKPVMRQTLDPGQPWDLRRQQSLPATGIDIVLLDDEGRRLPHGGVSVGEICLRGPWIVRSDHDLPDDATGSPPTAIDAAAAPEPSTPTTISN